MSETKRCPSCGAQNASTADWCTLCLTRFEGAPKLRLPPEPVVDAIEPEPEPESESAAAPASAPATETETETASASEETVAPPPPVAQAPVKFVREGDRVRWLCPSCDTVNDIDSGTCRICGTVMARLFAPEEAPAKPPSKSKAVTVALSVLLPGLGHIVQGEAATAVGRMLLYLWTAGISILLVARAPLKGRGVVQAVGILFAVAAAGIWLVTLVEASRISSGDRRPFVRARVITWIFTGLTVALFLGVLVAAAAGRSA